MAATRMAAAGPTRPEAGRPAPSFRKYSSLRAPNLLGAVSYYIDRLLVSFYDFRPIRLCQRQQWHRTRGRTKAKIAWFSVSRRNYRVPFVLFLYFFSVRHFYCSEKNHPRNISFSENENHGLVYILPHFLVLSWPVALPVYPLRLLHCHVLNFTRFSLQPS